MRRAPDGSRCAMFPTMSPDGSRCAMVQILRVDGLVGLRLRRGSTWRLLLAVGVAAGMHGWMRGFLVCMDGKFMQPGVNTVVWMDRWMYG